MLIFRGLENKMNPLQQLIQQYLSKNNLSRNVLIKKLGYTNTNKGLRRLDDFFINIRSPEDDFALRILQNTGIQKDQFNAAAQTIINKRHDEYRKIFKPQLKVIPISKPSLLLSLMHLNLKLPENINSLSYNEEIKVVCKLFLEFREKVKNNSPDQWASGEKGFKYYRNYGETLFFDKNCLLLDTA